MELSTMIAELAAEAAAAGLTEDVALYECALDGNEGALQWACERLAARF